MQSAAQAAGRQPVTHGAASREGAAQADRHHGSSGARYHGRFLSLHDLDRTHKAVLVLGYAALVAIAAMIVFHDAFETERVRTAAGLMIPRGVIFASIPPIVLAASLATTAAIIANPAIRYLCVAALAYFQLQIGQALPVQDSEVHHACIASALQLPVVALLGLAMLHRQIPGWLLAAGVLAVHGIIAAIFLILTATFHERLAPILVTALLAQALLLFVLPALLVVGADVVEWIEIAAEAASDVGAAWLPGAMIWLLALTGALSVAIAWPAIAGSSFGASAIAMKCLLLAAGFAGVMTLLIRFPPRSHHGHFGYLPVLALAYVIFYAGYAMQQQPLRQASALPPAFTVSGFAGFSIDLPPGWRAELRGASTRSGLVELHAPPAVRGFMNILVHTQAPPYRSINQIIADGDAFPVTLLQFSPADASGWRRFETTLRHSTRGGELRFNVWSRDTQVDVSRNHWTIVAACNVRSLAECLPAVESVVKSWRAAGPEYLWARILTWIGVAGFACGLMVRRHAKADAALWPAVAMVGALSAARGISGSGWIEAAVALDELMLQLAMVGAALLAPALLGYARLARRPRADLNAIIRLGVIVNLTLLAALWAGRGLLAAEHSAELSTAVKGLLVIAALTWELSASGSLTNIASRWFPRATRLLLFLAYILMLAVIVFYFFPLQAGGLYYKAFETEGIVVRGIVVLGVPLVLGVFALRLAAILRQAPDRTRGAR